MLLRLKWAIARRPVLAFVALGGAAWAAFLVVTLLGPHEWIDAASSLSHVALGLDALVCCWGVASRPDERPRRLLQLLIVSVVTALVMSIGVVRVWLLWRWESALWATVAKASSAVHVYNAGRLPSLASSIRGDLHSTPAWLVAITIGLVLGAVVSPYPLVRRTARLLLAWRSARVWSTVGLAVIVAAACVVVIRIAAGLVKPFHGYPDITQAYPASLFVVGFASALLTACVTAFAWFGFVAGRLASRLSALAIGLLIGLGIALPVLLAVWTDDLALAGGSLRGQSVALSIGEGLAYGVIGVWLTRRARGSLLPAVVWYAANGTGAEIAVRTSSVTRMYWMTQHYSIAVMVAAAVLVVVGRMWRRPDAAESPPSPLRRRRPPAAMRSSCAT